MLLWSIFTKVISSQDGEFLIYLVCYWPVLNRIQKQLRLRIGDELFSTLKSLFQSFSLAYRYCYGRCWRELPSLVPPGWSFTARTHCATFTVANLLHSFCTIFIGVSSIQTDFFQILLWGTNSWDDISLTDNYNLGVFNFRINWYLSSTSS